MSDEKGYIKLYRCIIDNDVVWEERATRLQAWLDLLMMANYQDKKGYFNKHFMEFKRGEIVTSEVKLAARWKWNKRTVTRFLNTLVEEKMIVVKKSHLYTTISVVNYDKYQGFSDDNCTTEYTTKYTTDNTTNCTTEYTTECTQLKKDKESIKKDKERKRNNKPPISPFEELEKTDLSDRMKNSLREWFTHKDEINDKRYRTEMSFKKFISEVKKGIDNHGEDKIVDQVDLAIARGWQGLNIDKMPKPQQQFNMDEFLRGIKDDV